MSLALVAALTGVCFAGAVAAVTIGLGREPRQVARPASRSGLRPHA